MAAKLYSLDLEQSSSQYARKTSPLDTMITIQSMTVEAWVKPESMSTLMPVFTVGGVGETEPENQVWDIIVETDGGLSLRWEYGAGTNEDVFSTTTGLITTGTWYHIAATRDNASNEVGFYVDGELIETVGFSNDATGGSAADLLIGADGNLTVFFDGLVTECRIWAGVRTQQQIASNMKVDVTGFRNLNGYYKTENNYLDQVGKNDLSAGNSPVFSSDVPFTEYEPAPGGLLGAEI